MTASTDIPPAALPGVAPAAQSGGPHPRSDGRDHSLFGADGLTFYDLLDIINPLQHLPILSNIYRELTGDDLSPGARMMGGGLFGGFIGFGVAMFNAIVEDLTGKDVGGHVFALFRGDGDQVAPAQVMLAAGEAPPAKTAPAAGSSPTTEPVPAPPVRIVAVHREELPPPPRLKPLSPPLAPPPAPIPALARAAGGAARLRPTEYLMNTELLNLLIFSVPVELGIGRHTPRDDAGHDRTSAFHDPDGPPPAIAHQAYQHGVQAHAAAVAQAVPGAAFVPLGPPEHL
jgi:hypothetical protein